MFLNVHASLFSCHVQLTVTPWTVTCQAPLPMGFSWQQYWSGLPCPSSRGYLPDPGIEPTSLVSTALQVYSLLLNHWESPYFLILLVINGNANHNRGKIPILINKNINKYIVKSCANKFCNRHGLLSDLYL